MSNDPAPKENNATGALLTWAACAGFFVVCLGVIAVANYRSRPAAAVDADLVARRQALLKETTARGMQLITEPGKNADGTYRIPVDAAVQVLLRDAQSLHLVQELARRKPAAPPPETDKAAPSEPPQPAPVPAGK